MFSFTYRHRVRYRECDPMGVVYHGHYLDYLEYARTEALRNAGLPYRQLEESGIIMPVVDISIRYLSPARYDDLLEVTTRVAKMPSVKVVFDYDVSVVEDARTAEPVAPRLSARAEVTLCFVDAKTGRPRRAPESVTRVLADAFARLH